MTQTPQSWPLPVVPPQQVYSNPIAPSVAGSLVQMSPPSNGNDLPKQQVTYNARKPSSGTPSVAGSYGTFSSPSTQAAPALEAPSK